MNSQSEYRAENRIGAELDKLIEAKVRLFKQENGRLVRWSDRFCDPLREGPLPELHYDWCTVQGFADRARLSVIAEQGERGAQDPDNGERLRKEKSKHRYATVQAYLNLAKKDRNPGRAWDYVNSADKILTLIVDSEDLNWCLHRLRSWDSGLIERKKDLKEVLEKLDQELKSEQTKQAEKERTGGMNPKTSTEVSVKGQVDSRLGRIAYRGQATRAKLWYDFNSSLTFRFSLWDSYNLKLLLTLAAVIPVFEFVYHAVLFPREPIWYLPFLYVSIAGLLGGVLSSSLVTRDLVERTTSPQLIRVLTSTRALLGAAGAVVVYTILASGLVAGVDISQLLRDNVYVLLSTGIAGGFSEQFYISAIDKHAKNLDLVGAEK